MSEGIEFLFDLEHLSQGVFMLDKKADAAVKLFAETQAKALEADAKDNRPWKDRTGDARKRLTGYVEETPTGYRLVLAHGVDYGLWLELANEGNYAVVGPTIDIESPYIMREFEGLLYKMGY